MAKLFKRLRDNRRQRRADLCRIDDPRRLIHEIETLYSGQTLEMAA